MNFIKAIGLTLFLAFLGGCSSSSVFVPYPAQMDSVKSQLATGQFSGIQKELDKKRDSSDKILYLMERGRVSQLAQDYDSSIKDFAEAIDAIEANRNKAKITATGAASQAGALMLNDNAIPYEGDAYERVFIYNYQALNYLFKKDLEAAGVEVRRANLEQKEALEEYSDELQDTENSPQAERILNGSGDYMSKFDALSRLAGKVKNSFQNAYTFYISGVIYEARGEYNDAFIDYKKALEIFPDNRYIIADVTRLAKKLGMRDDYARLKDKADPTLTKPPRKNQGEIVVLYEHGYVPEKEQVKIPMVILNKLQTLTFPTYIARPVPYPTLTLSVSGKTAGSTQEIVDVSALAAKALQEHIPAILVRQALRMIARDKTKENVGGPLALVTDIAHLMINNADRRSWLTLPAGAQIMHTVAESGPQEVTITAGAMQHSLSLEVKPGKTTILHVVATGGRLNVSSVDI